MVRGYHEYQHIWDAVVGEILPCNCETGNVHDPYAVSIKKGGVIVGHVPKKLSCLCSLFLQWGGIICCEVTGLRRYYSDLPQGGLEIPCNIVFKGHLKEIEKVKKVLKLTESDSPSATTETVDNSGKNTQSSDVDLQITKSPSAAISVSEPTSAVVKITKSLGASVTLSKQHLPFEESDDHRKSNKLAYSIKVEDSPYASVDLTHGDSSDVPCSSSSLSDEIRSLVNPEELLRICTGAKLTDLSINMAQKMLKKQFPKLNGLISTLVQEKKFTYKPTKNQLQIIHSRDDHWIVASSALSKKNENEVHV